MSTTQEDLYNEALSSVQATVAEYCNINYVGIAMNRELSQAIEQLANEMVIAITDSTLDAAELRADDEELDSSW